MKVKILGLEDAFQLASALSKYVDVNALDPETDALAFISDLLEKLTPADYLKCVMILTEKTEEDVEKEIGLDLLTAFIEGLKENRIISLLSFCKSLGF